MLVQKAKAKAKLFRAKLKLFFSFFSFFEKKKLKLTKNTSFLDIFGNLLSMSVQHMNKEYKVIRTTGRTDTKDIYPNLR